MNIRNILLLLVLGTLFACEPSLDEFTTTAGSADFTKYVAIGNSLTAGFADGDLYRSGQENSYPAILAYQMEAAGGGAFKQPLMFDEYGFGSRRLLDASIPAPVMAGVTPSEQNFVSIANEGPFNNMGVVGAKSFHLVPGAEAYSNLNPYYRRFAASPGVSTVLGEAMAQNPSFFTVWIGSNDVLFYAYDGGTIDSITDPALLQQAIGGVLTGMTSNGAKGAIANIPNITDIPFFSFMNTQLPYNGLVVSADTAALLNYVYQQFELALASYGITYSYGFNFVEGPNAFVVYDETIPFPDALAAFRVRQMQPDELFILTLPVDSMYMGMGSVKMVSATELLPWGVPDEYFLSSTEINDIETATAQYNQIIAGLANQFDLALVDMNQHMNTLATSGITVDGITFTNAFISGKAFSLDGIHLTAQGSAVIANFFIDAINAKYGSDLKQVSPRLYPGIYYYQ